MKTKVTIFFLCAFSLGSVYADDTIVDFQAVHARLNSLQSVTPGLPSGVSEPKGRIGFIISKLFDANGKVGNKFLKAFSSDGADFSITGNANIGGTATVNGELKGITKLSFDSGGNHRIDTNVNGMLFDGGDGAWDFLVYDNMVYSDKLKLGYTGNVEISTYDLNEDLTIDPSGIGKTILKGDVDVSGNIAISGTPTAGSHAITKSYVDTAISSIDRIWSKNGSKTYYNSGNVGIGTIDPKNKLHVSGNIGATGWIGAGCEGACDSGGGYALMYGDGHTVIRPSYAGYALNAKTSSATHGGVLGYTQNSGAYGILGQANAYGVYGQSNSSYGVYGRTTKDTSGGVLGYNYNATSYGILGFGTNYAFYGKGDGYFSGNVIAKNPTADNHLTTKSYVDTAVSGAGGLWSKNGAKIYYNSGNVGIGTTNPGTKLDISGITTTQKLIVGTNTQATTADIKLGMNANIATDNSLFFWVDGANDGGDNFYFRKGIGYGAGTNLMSILNNGDISVSGNIKTTGRNILFGTGEQRIYGDNVSQFYVDSNHDTVSSMVFRDKQDDVYGYVYGSQGDYFGLLDGDGNWSHLIAKDSYVQERINNIARMHLDTDNMYLRGQQLQIGWNRTGNRLAYTDYVGDDTYTDYGLRVMRGNGGANTFSQIVHRGTGPLYVSAQDAGDVILRTNNTSRLTVQKNTGNVGIGTTNPGAKLEVVGKIIADNPTAGNHVATKSYVDAAVSGAGGSGNSYGGKGTPDYEIVLNDGSQISNYVCKDDIDLTNICGDIDGCSYKIFMTHKHPSQPDTTIMTNGEMYIENPSFSKNNSAGYYGYILIDGTARSFINGTGVRMENIFDLGSWAYLMNYKSVLCPANSTNSAYPASQPYRFSFMVHPHVQARLMFWD